MRSSNLEGLLKKKEQMEAKIKTVMARDALQKRKDDNRKKILVGSYFIDKFEKEGAFADLISKLDKFLLRKNDRALFGLPDRETKNNLQN